MENLTEKRIVNDNTLDILETFQDALEIVYGCDSDEFVFSETSMFKPPSFMVSAAVRGLRIQNRTFGEDRYNPELGLDHTHKIANGEKLNIREIKRLRSWANRHRNDISPSEDGSSKLTQMFLLKGIPASERGAERVIAWADARIKDYRRKGNAAA